MNKNVDTQIDAYMYYSDNNPWYMSNNEKGCRPYIYRGQWQKVQHRIKVKQDLIKEERS